MAKATTPGAVLLAFVVLGLALDGCEDEEAARAGIRIQHISVIPRLLAPGDSAQACVLAEEAAGRRLDVRWQAAAGGFAGSDSGTCVTWVAPHSTGIYPLWVWVSDGAAEESDSVLVEVADREPRLAVTPASLEFGAQDTAKVLLVRNDGARTLAWTASAGESFTTVSPASGRSRQEAPVADTILVEVGRTGLDPGAYADTVRIASNGGEAAVPISFEVPGTPVWSYAIVDSFPHDRSAFTQGLVVRDGILYEGTGRYGSSYVRALELETGRLLRSKKLRGSYFGEGIALVDSLLYQLTLNAGLALVYEESSFERLFTVPYSSEGWGLAYDPIGNRLVRSDGSERIYFHDPLTFELLGHIDVYDRDAPVWRLNELEVIGGVLFANVWKTNRLARIDLASGQVLSWVDLTGLEALADYGSRIDVLNGIAYDEASGRLFVTGKLWPVLFEITLVAPGQVASRSACVTRSTP